MIDSNLIFFRLREGEERESESEEETIHLTAFEHRTFTSSQQYHSIGVVPYLIDFVSR